MAENKFITAMRYSLTVCSAVAVVENLLVIVVFAGTKRLRIKYYVFIANLALADLLFAVVEIPSAWEDTSYVLNGLLTACYCVSILTILAVAANRYLALSLMPPARYDALVTGCRLIGVCIIFWCLSIIYGLLVNIITSWEDYFLVDYLIYPPVIVTIWVITVVLCCLAFRKIKQYNPPLATSPGVNPNADRDDTRVRQTRRLLVTFVLILMTSFLSWMPYELLKVISYFDPSSSYDSYGAYFWGTSFIYCLSTMINPLIYWWRVEGFREGFYAIFSRCVIRAESGGTGAEPSANEQTIAETGS